MAVNNSLAPQVHKKQGFSAIINSVPYQRMIANTLKDKKTADRFVASVVSAVATNPALAECEAKTIVSAALLGESLKLSPSPTLGHFYMVPFKTNKKNEYGKAYKDSNGNYVKETNATFVLGYKGYIQLATRSGQYKRINVLPIKQGEFISWNPLTEDLKISMIEDETERENALTVGYYASFEYLNGFTKTIYWSKEKMLAHADRYSQAFSAQALRNIEDGKVPEKDMWKYSSFWYKDFDGMACKTMLRQLISKWGIMSIDMQKAYEADGGTINEDGTIAYPEVQEQPTEIIQPAQAEPESTETVDIPTVEEQEQQSFDEFAAIFG